uniref:NADH-ubiquinone oxidoreductase chain 6 n=1 Tax=Priasilpha obscura TaxID=295936 RepID=B6D8Y0_9CUCU|nr:NADH dehydrogenase subunit 6 [Priasilpha obscura]ACF35118.1 NADH dehydrogenase subunit 6 [Priasilpha obscura]
MNMILSLTLIMSLMFLFLNHPLSFGLILLIQTILISMITGNMSLNYWYSYMLMLIMVGGMLILFMYMTSIASNEKFKFSFKLMIFMLLSAIIMSMLLMIDHYFLNFFSLNENMIKQDNFSYFYISMNKYLNFPSIIIFLTIIIYLFITLIAVVKITNINYGPLRQKF